MDLTKIPTCQLVEELSGREGVKKITADPYQPYSVACEAEQVSDTGPAVILVVTD